MHMSACAYSPWNTTCLCVSVSKTVGIKATKETCPLEDDSEHQLDEVHQVKLRAFRI